MPIDVQIEVVSSKHLIDPSVDDSHVRETAAKEQKVTVFYGTGKGTVPDGSQDGADVYVKKFTAPSKEFKWNGQRWVTADYQLQNKNSKGKGTLEYRGGVPWVKIKHIDS